MRVRFAAVALLIVPPMFLVACGDGSRSTGPLAPTLSDVFASATHAHASASDRLVTMMDACDPATFNAVIGPGTCVNRNGGITFSGFIAQLTRTQKAGSWMFAPPQTTAAAGVTLIAVNRGGEAHTFTRVAAFGGGIVPILNQLSGNPVPAPECLALGPADFVPPGGTFTAQVSAAGTHLFECCLHPWMRTTVHVR